MEDSYVENDIETAENVCSPSSQKSSYSRTWRPRNMQYEKGDFSGFNPLSRRQFSLFNSFFKIKDSGMLFRKKIGYWLNYLITCFNFTPKEFCPTKKYSDKREITRSFKNNTVTTKICLFCAVRILLANRLKEDKQFRLRNLRKCTTRKKYPLFLPIRGIINTWETDVCWK